MNDYRKIFLENMYYLMAKKQWTLTRLSIEADVPFSTINTMLYNSKGAPKIETAGKIAKSFGITVSDILDQDLIKRMKINECFESACRDAAEDLQNIEKSIESFKAILLKNNIRIEERTIPNKVKGGDVA